MLVLSRKQDQTIRIGDAIEITSCKVQGNRVSLAINAPLDVPVMRGELLKDKSGELKTQPLRDGLAKPFPEATLLP